jgi:hypothetical protein
VVMDGPKTEDCCSRPNTSSLSSPRRLRWSSLLYQPLQHPRGAGAAPRRAAATARTCRRRHLGTLSIHSPQSTRPPLPSASRGLEEAAVETRPDAAGTQQRAGRPSGGGGGEQRKPQAGKQVSIRTLPSLIPWKCVFDPVQRKCEQKSDAFIY